MNNPPRQIMDELEETDSCLCLNENSCCVTYGYKPIVNFMISPIIDKFFKPVGKGFKKIFKNCIMVCGSCSIGCFKIPGGDE